MASPNSWTLPGNGFLGGMNLGPSSLDDPNSEPENPWAKALREAIERQPPSEALRLGTVDEQIRASANSGNPLARPTQALIDWWRRPPAPPQMPQKRTIGPAPYYALDFDDMYPSARIGRAFINHYADYFDPWTYDEQGRRVADTPAAYTPNAAGKLAPTRKPEWWPLVGIADMGSNFVGAGALANTVKAATVGGRAAFATSKAAAAEAGMAGKLLNAVREGRLAELAGERAGAAGGGARGNPASAMEELNGYHLVGGADGTIFRNGGTAPNNLTPRPKDEDVLSFRDSLSNPYPLPPGQVPVLRIGNDYRQFDVSKLPPGSVIFDHNPPGHVGVRGVSLQELRDAIVGKGKFK
jgi:hypothetical protein